MKIKKYFFSEKQLKKNLPKEFASSEKDFLLKTQSNFKIPKKWNGKTKKGIKNKNPSHTLRFFCDPEGIRTPIKGTGILHSIH